MADRTVGKVAAGVFLGLLGALIVLAVLVRLFLMAV